MTAVCCVLSLLSATIFPVGGDVASIDVETAPLSGLSFVPRSPTVAPSVYGPGGDGYTDIDRALDELLTRARVEFEASLPVAEMPGTPPDSEPIPFRPTPNQPDGPAIPPPRNVVHDASLRDRALTQFIALGAVQWQVDAFDCVGSHESGWSNAIHLNANGSIDRGVMQENSIHDAQLRAEGLDPMVPEDAATFAWELSYKGTRFSPWAVHSLCGV